MVSASAMLVLSVAVLLSVEQIRPVVREIQRETAVERAAVRQLAGHLARAVRGLAGGGVVQSADRPAPARPWGCPSTITVRYPEAIDLPCGVCRPRDALVDLPPPAAC